MNDSSIELLFQLIDVSFYYPAEDGHRIPILKNISLKIEKGRWVSVVGRNGSGKTTLSRLFCGLINPSEGEILVEGKRIEELKNEGELPKIIGYLFSDPENQIVYPIVEEDIAFGPTNLGFPSSEIKGRVEEALQMVGLEGYQKKTVALLSGGEMKKVALAGILAMGPKAIILDEPFLMLDPKGILEMIDIIKRLRDQGITVVSTMSSLEEAASSDRVMILKEGEIILEGKFKEILSKKDIIEDAGFDLPKITQLVYRLREGGISIPLEILSVEDMSGFLLSPESGIKSQRKQEPKS
jgi:energy-coupling factor transport system ATP-binding protein